MPTQNPPVSNLTITPQQLEAKLAIMAQAAVMAAAIMSDPATAQAMKASVPSGTLEDAFNRQHARCYQYLLVRVIPDETVYTSPVPPTAPVPAAGSGLRQQPTITPSALQSALTSAISDPAQIAAIVAKLSPLLGLAGPQAAAAVPVVAAVANSIAAQTPTPAAAPAVAPLPA